MFFGNLLSDVFEIVFDVCKMYVIDLIGVVKKCNFKMKIERVSGKLLNILNNK